MSTYLTKNDRNNYVRVVGSRRAREQAGVSSSLAQSQQVMSKLINEDIAVQAII
jgi:hypothetical protein